jgi:hypothetical protein
MLRFWQSSKNNLKSLLVRQHGYEAARGTAVTETIGKAKSNTEQ